MEWKRDTNQYHDESGEKPFTSGVWDVCVLMIVLSLNLLTLKVALPWNGLIQINKENVNQSNKTSTYIYQYIFSFTLKPIKYS